MSNVKSLIFHTVDATFATLVFLLGAPAAYLLSQVSGNLDPGIATLVGNGVTVAVLAWYVLHDVRTRTPAMLAAFAAEQAELRKVFDTKQDELRTSYNMIIDGIRQTFSQEQNALRATFVQESQAARVMYDKQLSESRQMLYETMTSMRTAVHDVKNTAQTLINKQTLKEELDKRS